MTNDDGFSRLDDAGVAEIERTRTARFDLSQLSISRDELGLAPDSLGPVVGRAGAPAFTLEMTAPEGTEEVRTPTFSVAFNGPDPQADYLTWFEGYDSRQEADAAPLRSAIGRWGFQPEELERWHETLELSGTEKARSTTGLGVSSSGLVVEGILSGTKTGGQTHRFQVLLGPRYYEPAALTSIRRTGALPD